MNANELTQHREVSCRKIAFTLIDTEKGEEKAHTCEIA
jgi:hypothetical protein